MSDDDEFRAPVVRRGKSKIAVVPEAKVHMQQQSLGHQQHSSAPPLSRPVLFNFNSFTLFFDADTTECDFRTKDASDLGRRYLKMKLGKSGDFDESGSMCTLTWCWRRRVRHMLAPALCACGEGVCDRVYPLPTVTYSTCVSVVFSSSPSSI